MIRKGSTTDIFREHSKLRSCVLLPEKRPDVDLEDDLPLLQLRTLHFLARAGFPFRQLEALEASRHLLNQAPRLHFSMKDQSSITI